VVLREMPLIADSLGHAPNMLHTFEEVTSLAIDFHAIMAHSHKRETLPIPNKIRAATVVTRPVMIGISRIFESLNGNPQIAMRTFADRAFAERWLAGLHTPEDEVL
jgi:hypothetical protein